MSTITFATFVLQRWVFHKHLKPYPLKLCEGGLVQIYEATFLQLLPIIDVTF